ncbi:glycosyltransferase [Roseisolibacter sp. H3M3-2]|uniref:glycosyltransferase n=1 Tax=Roseisolibacter sp. H3M3-2 TaxID=3031323 RepID=UPI0023D9B2BC|nr:glycosyltransferase [Roseisolibacter sp. H3M3-2]MDF1502347.1 glycosyltransferase [Roseisolibacter sp. H3M3-2]
MSGANGAGGRPRVAHVTTVHGPRDVRICLKEAATLAANGFEVLELAARADRAEEVRGVRIVPVGRARNRVDRFTRVLWRTYREARRSGASVFHLHDPELLPLGFALKLHGKRVVYDVHENVHLDIVAKPWLPSWSKPFLGWATQAVEALAARAFDQVVPATEGIAVRFPPEKTTRVRNAPYLAELYDPATARPFAERSARVAYVGGLGGLGDLKGVGLMLRAMAALPPDSPVRLVLGGPEPHPGFAEALRREPGGDRVDYVGLVDREQLRAILDDAIAGLVLYPPMPNNVDSEPVKFFEFLSAAIPVISSDFPLLRGLVERWECGRAVDAMDAEAVAAAIVELDRDRALAERLGRGGRAGIEREWNWEQEGDKLVALYRRLTAGGR